MPEAPPSVAPNEPYCGQCGYALVGLTESSRCPECGRPLVEVLQRRGTIALRGRRYRSETRVFGLPLVCVALGPHENERIGVARGIIAIGDVAIGWLALGGTALGGIALGGLAAGIVSFGGLAVALLCAAGGGAISGGLAVGGGAVGGVAVGGAAIGYVAEGGGAIGVYARGGEVYATHAIDRMGRNDAAAVRVFERLAWLLGRGPGLSVRMAAWPAVAALIVGTMLGILVEIRMFLNRRAGGRERSGDSNREGLG